MKVEGMIYYETPAATVVEVKTEGVVCQSPVKGGNSINDWENGGTIHEDIYYKTQKTDKSCIQRISS